MDGRNENGCKADLLLHLCFSFRSHFGELFNCALVTRVILPKGSTKTDSFRSSLLQNTIQLWSVDTEKHAKLKNSDKQART